MMKYWNKEILVLGCGNVLFGDDGFGPAVVEYLQHNFYIPAHICVLNVGISVREILFNIILNEKCPQRIIIIDAVDLGRKPGEVFEIDISEIPQQKIDDFSMHQLPTSNLLYELKNMKGIDIKIISTQVEHIPESVSPGLSRVVEESIPLVCEEIYATLK